MERLLQLMDIMDDYLGPLVAFVSFWQILLIGLALAAALALGFAGVPFSVLAVIGLLLVPAMQVLSAATRAMMNALAPRPVVLRANRSGSPATPAS